MNAAPSISLDVETSGLTSPDSSLENLMVQLDHFRRQSEQLSLKNELHRRLAGAIDMASMVEAYSVWLMPLVEHSLVSFKHIGRKRQHIFCSSHGPKRRRGIQTIEEFFQGLGVHHSPNHLKKGSFNIHCWPVTSDHDTGFLVLLRSGRALTKQESRVIENSLEILTDTLYRVMGYEDLFEQSRRDALTGLANRRVFEERIGPIIDNSRRHGYPLSLISMDLDRFKLINDTFGHAQGDEVLKQIAELFAGMVRSTDLLVRMGGDEFLLVLPDTPRNAAKKLGERLCKAIDKLNVTIPGAGRLGISIGLSQWQNDWTKEEWMQRADEALYRAKFSDRSKVCML